MNTSVAEEIESQLRADLFAVPVADFAAETRPSWLGELMIQTEEGTAELQALATDDRVMLSLLVASVSETRALELGAAAVEVTPVLRWSELVGLLGDEILDRRVAELAEAVRDGRMQITQEEQAALDLAANYASGRQPQTPFEQQMGHVVTHADASAETVNASQSDRDDDQVGEP